MEDINKEEIEAVQTPVPEESDESQDSDDKDIDYAAELARVKSTEQPKERTELEKAQRALHFNAQRLKELGGDPAEILGVKPVVKEAEPSAPVSRADLERTFIERDARNLTESDAEFELTMHYVDKGLSLEDAHLLANKGKIKRSVQEARRGNVAYAPATSTQKVTTERAPTRSPEEQAVLQRRGLSYNPKTGTWQGRFSEEYYDHEAKTWRSRKLSR